MSAISITHTDRMDVFKDNLLTKLGGPSQFQFLLISYVENIQDSLELEEFFANFDLKSLVALQKTLLMAAFLQPATPHEK